MTKKLTKGFSDFFQQFPIRELKLFKDLDWPDIFFRARKLSKQLEGCQNCGKKERRYSCNIKVIDKGKDDCGIFMEKFCSLNCFNEYVNKHIQNDQLVGYPELLSPKLQNRVTEFLAWCLEPKEVKELNLEKLLALTKERIKNYEKSKECTSCGKKEQNFELSILNTKTNSLHNLAYGDFCSKGCLKKYVNEKV